MLFDPYITNTYLEDKYFVYYRKMVKTRTISKSIKDLTDVHNPSQLLNEPKKAEKRRKFHQSSILKESYRGLPSLPLSYASHFQPILLEEVWKPEFDESKSEETSESETKSTVEEEKTQSTHDTHLIFLVHGYLSKASDMDRVEQTLRQRCRGVRLYSCRSIEDVQKGIFSLGKGNSWKSESSRQTPCTRDQKRNRQSWKDYQIDQNLVHRPFDGWARHSSCS